MVHEVDHTCLGHLQAAFEARYHEIVAARRVAERRVRDDGVGLPLVLEEVPVLPDLAPVLAHALGQVAVEVAVAAKRFQHKFAFDPRNQPDDLLTGFNRGLIPVASWPEGTKSASSRPAGSSAVSGLPPS